MYANGQLPQNRVDLNKLKVREPGCCHALGGPDRSCGRAGARVRYSTPVPSAASHRPYALYFAAPPLPPQVQTLRKYSKQFEVQGVHPTSSKEDIAKAVSDHWNTVVRWGLAIRNCLALPRSCMLHGNVDRKMPP